MRSRDPGSNVLLKCQMQPFRPRPRVSQFPQLFCAATCHHLAGGVWCRLSTATKRVLPPPSDCGRAFFSCTCGDRSFSCLSNQCESGILRLWPELFPLWFANYSKHLVRYNRRSPASGCRLLPSWRSSEYPAPEVVKKWRWSHEAQIASTLADHYEFV